MFVFPFFKSMDKLLMARQNKHESESQKRKEKEKKQYFLKNMLEHERFLKLEKKVINNEHIQWA